MVLENPTLYTKQCIRRITDFAEVQHNLYCYCIKYIFTSQTSPRNMMIYYTQPHFWDGLHVNEEVRFKKFKINPAVVINCDIPLIPKTFLVQ